MTLRIIAGKFKGRPLKTPKGSATRPTQSMLREAVFNICQQEISGSRVLDLFAGSGAMGFEALSRGAQQVVFIEKDRNASLCIRENIKLLDVEPNAILLQSEAFASLKRLKDSFDLIYIDPPYEMPSMPYVDLIIESNLLKRTGTLFIEERFDPKKNSPPPEWAALHLKESRRFGSALLHRYIHK